MNPRRHAVMTGLTHSDFEKIGDYLIKRFPVLEQTGDGSISENQSFLLQKRTLIVEEELKHQRELMQRALI